MERLDQILLSHDVMLRSGNRSRPLLLQRGVLLSGLNSARLLLRQLQVSRRLLLREHQRCLLLLQRRLELIERRLVLSNLVIEFRNREVRP
jgi:hypothetical protein